MPDYRRVRVPGGTYFFTVTLSRRDRRLLVEYIDQLRMAWQAARMARPFEVVAAVVLPDHLHCVWRLPESDDDYATRWRHIKALFSRSVPDEGAYSRKRALRGERGIWQRRYWEHLIRDERDLVAHIDYIHFNPVKHGLVAEVRDWPYSTFHRYVRQGVLAPDWASDPPYEPGW